MRCSSAVPSISGLKTLGRLQLLARGVHLGLPKPLARLPGQTPSVESTTRRGRTRPLSALPSEGFSS